MGPVQHGDVCSKRAARGSGAVSLLVLAALGCGDPSTFYVTPESDYERDAAVPRVDGGMSNAPEPPQAPAPPALPRWACPAGWSIRGTSPETTCEPWETGFSSCPDGEMRTPGSSACEALGDPCPAGDFAEPRESDGPAWFVRPGASGSGTREQPFGSLADALDRAQGGDAIFLARGSYADTAELTDAVTLVGACAGSTTFEAPSSAPSPTLTVSSPGVVLRGIAVRGGGGAGLVVEAGGAVHGEGLLFDRIPGMAVAVEGGEAVLTSLHVRQSGAGAGINAAAVRVRQGGSLTLDHALLEENRLHGILALGDGTAVALRDVAIRSTSHLGAVEEPGQAGAGAGLWLGFGARGTLSRAVVEANGRVGVEVMGRADLVATDLVVRDSTPTSAGDWGEGIFVEAATLDLRRALVSDNSRTGVRVDERQSIGPSPAVRLEDLIIRGTRPRPEDDRLGIGLKVTSPDAQTPQEQAVVTGERLLIEDNHRAGIRGENARITLADVTVRNTRVSPGNTDGGFGLRLSGGSTSITRAVVSENREAGIHLDTPGTTATLSDVVIRDTQSRDAPAVGGRAINAIAGTTVQLERALLERNRESAIAMYGPSSHLSLDDVTIRDTYGRSADGRFGAAITTEATQIVGSRVRVERSRQVALWIGRESVLDLSDVLIRDALPQECASDGCPEFGVGIGAYQASQVDVDRFEVVGASLCGVQVAARGQLDLVRGTVSDNVFGACLGDESYDIGRLSADVAYWDNSRNVEANSLPIPDPSPPLIFSSSD